MTKKINSREENLLSFLWSKNIPMTSSEMMKCLEPEGWKQITLMKTIQSLVEKDYLEVVGLEKAAKTYARQFYPKISKDEFFYHLIEEKNIDEKSFINITAAFLGNCKIDQDSKEELIGKLENLIEEFKRSV
ncbi:MAG: BlaI/MecI/CopY family transcriptional regulator [Lachnospiraceae bacterium]|nr:BlaI/MecI/CopY family transcriptional regulator [Lachnospiraceae bacterium]